MPSMVQRFFTTVLPGLAESMERESREWMMRCDCGHEKSIWEIGGIRFGASGSPRRYGHCSACGKFSWLKVYRKRLVSPADSSC